MNGFWITGAYKPRGRGNFNWISFAYGPFPDQEVCHARADDDKMMAKVIGTDIKNVEIVCTDSLSYNQASKHFEDTIPSEHFEEWNERNRDALTSA